MKYLIVLGDGMADYPVQSLHGKTPLSVAKKPMMDALAKKGELGLVTTVPAGFTPGSDVANLGVLGYDVRECYTGRSPLEALSIGVHLGEDDVAIRTNLVTLSNEEDFFDKTMVDYSAGEITTEESEVLMKAVADEFSNDVVNFYSGTSYRNLLVLRGVGKEKAKDFVFTPPHDITGQPIKNHLPKGEMSEVLLDVLVRSHQVLKNHPINQKRKEQVKQQKQSQNQTHNLRIILFVKCQTYQKNFFLLLWHLTTTFSMQGLSNKHVSPYIPHEQLKTKAISLLVAMFSSIPQRILLQQV